MRLSPFCTRMGTPPSIELRCDGVTVELQNLGMLSCVRYQRAYRTRIQRQTGEWRVSITGSRATENWEMRVEDQRIRTVYSLASSSGEHEPEAIGELVLSWCPQRRNLDSPCLARCTTTFLPLEYHPQKGEYLWQRKRLIPEQEAVQRRYGCSHGLGYSRRGELLSKGLGFAKRAS